MITGFGILAAGLSGCSISQTEEPPLQGPSELALAFSLQAIPDVLTQDGASQSQVVVQARGANGQPARSVTFRADILVGDIMTDFGSLSARTLVTGNDGRATLTYTAPPAVSSVSVDTGQQVAIRVTPFGTDFANSLPRIVSIRLIPPGVLLPGGPIPPASPAPPFTFTPTTPAAFTDVTFDASGWTPAPTTQLTSFTWNFGDGSTASDIQVVHQFKPGTFVVTLTVTDSNGVPTSAQRSITVGAGEAPTADFVFSPASPVVNQDILFNAGTSTAATGRSIVSYNWNMGSGAPRTGRTFTKSYDVAGSYNVVLTVTDDVGQTGTTTKQVVVGGGAALTASFTFSPTNPSNGITVNFNGSGSTTPSGTTITSYDWDFGDGSTGSGVTTSHPYAVTASRTFVVRLTVTNSAGQTATTTQSVAVTFP